MRTGILASKIFAVDKEKPTADSDQFETDWRGFKKK
jgi:hypothetical protein